jgi:choline kinase
VARRESVTAGRQALNADRGCKRYGNRSGYWDHRGVGQGGLVGATGLGLVTGAVGMTSPSCAVLLVAGEGKRLRPLTLDRPKCMVRVHDQTIIENAMHALADAGCRRVRVVTGYLSHVVEEALGRQLRGMDVAYIVNTQYAASNSMYSLYLGLAGVAEPTWVIEGDVYFEPSVVAQRPCSGIEWLVDSAQRKVDGCYLAVGGGGGVQSVDIVREVSLLLPNQSKSVGMLRLCAGSVTAVRRWLEEAVAAGRQTEYYDTVLADHLQDCEVRALDIVGRRWCEVDTPADLDACRQVFA